MLFIINATTMIKNIDHPHFLRLTICDCSLVQSLYGHKHHNPKIITTICSGTVPHHIQHTKNLQNLTNRDVLFR